MPVLAAFALAAAGDRKHDVRLPAAGMVLSGLGDTALLGCGELVRARHGRLRRGARLLHHRARQRTARPAGCARASPPATRRRGRSSSRSCGGVSAACASPSPPTACCLSPWQCWRPAATARPPRAARCFVVSDALIACGLAGINAVPRQESAVMPTYVAAQFLLAAGFLRPHAAPQALTAVNCFPGRTVVCDSSQMPDNEDRAGERVWQAVPPARGKHCLVSCIATERLAALSADSLRWAAWQATCRDPHRRRDLHRLRHPRLSAARAACGRCTRSTKSS